MMSAYLVLEGPDGGGKSTQATALADWLRGLGREVMQLREPGSTTVGEALRRLLLDPSSGELSTFTEALLFSAARTELVRAAIAPALANGMVVVAERCYLSTLVYQGLAAVHDAVPMRLLHELAERAQAGTWPDLILVLDVDWRERSRRTRGTVADRIEARGEAHHESVRQSYLELARGDHRCAVIDASGDVEEVAQRIAARVGSLLGVGRR
jgi:dTMP kinase